jgi:two-component system sensor histidine kinase BaeS
MRPPRARARANKIRGMRRGLFWKLFVLQVLAAAAVLAGALALSRQYSMRGFAEYVEQQQRARVQQLAAQIAQDYAKNGGDLAAASEGIELLHRWPRHRPGPPPGEREERVLRDEPGDEPPQPDDRRHELPRRRIVMRHEARTPPMQLQDAQGEYVRGDPRPLPPERARLREPITVDGAVVGYLAWPPVHVSPEQIEFAHKQSRHLAIIAPVALLVAAAFAMLITGLIVKPIRQLSAGATALTRREFATRLPADRADEIGQLAADFNRLAAALEAYDGRQRQWLADIAHELRTPLAVLRGELEAVQEGVRTVGPGLLESLRQEVQRLETLIEDLHLVSLAESGGLRLHLSDADVGVLTGTAVKRFGPQLAAKGFELRTAIEQGLRAHVDVQRFDQVLGNTLRNVLTHATPPGPVTVAARADAGGIVVSVADAGPGVPDAALPRLFDRLYRVDSSRSRGVGGAGLGLSICRSIVEAHGGTIAAQKSAAGGLEIVIRLVGVAPAAT